MYKENKIQQLNIDDPIYNLTNREIKMLKKSWAYDFGNKIFPLINEDRFSCLYSDHYSRPNTPVNVMIGALIIKEMTDQSDDEILESLMFDIRYQYALHTTSFTEQPLSDKSLQRFRKRLYTYETENNVDLIKETMKDINDELMKLMGINPSLKRMDSFMIASNIKTLSRLELLYTCVADMVKYLHDHDYTIDEDMKHYCHEDDHNKEIYHNHQSTEEKIKKILKDAKRLQDRCEGHFDDVTQYQLLIRVINEQAVTQDKQLRLKTKEDKDMDSHILQSPYDPEATYREKAGKQYRGYVSNITETGEKGKTIITDYQFDNNTHSDQAFLDESIEEMISGTTLVVDGAYGSVETIEAAKEKGIEIIPTDLSGKRGKDIYADFEIREDGKAVISCANGIEPKKNTYNDKTNQIVASFDAEKCKGCPYQQQCHPKMNKKTSRVTISNKAVLRARLRRKIESKEYEKLLKYRNGIEAIPSIMRRKYHIDKMPVRGKERMRLFLGFKVIAFNIAKYNKQVRGNYAFKQEKLCTC